MGAEMCIRDRYHLPLYFPGIVDIGTVVTKVGNSSYNLGQGIFREDECIATAEVVTVSFDPKSKTSKPIDSKLRDILYTAMLNQ